MKKKNSFAEGMEWVKKVMFLDWLEIMRIFLHLFGCLSRRQINYFPHTAELIVPQSTNTD